MFNNEEIKLFSIAIGLEKPWEIYEVKLDENKDLHIYIKFKRGSKFECKECGKKCNVHDTIEKTWRHLNFFEHKTYIHARVPRIICEDHKIHLIEVPWARRNTGFTTRFEELVMALAKKMSVLSITKILDESYGKIWRIIRKYADEYIENINCEEVTQIGLDETSRKGHEYITVFIDLKTSRVIYIANGKSSATIGEFKKFFEEHGGNVEKVTDVTCDMSMGFTSGIKATFPNCKIIYDKFHVMKLINEALDKVRKKEVIENEELKGTRYIWLKNKENLTNKQEKEFKRLSKMNLKTGTAYRLKVAMQDIYSLNYTVQMAIDEIDEWISWALRSKLEEFKNVARTIKSKMRGICNYFESRLTNAVLEGTNSMIQNIKSRARGYKNIENFKAMIYLMNSENRVKG